MDKFHNQVLRHLIYAILWEDDGDELVFVGKTTTSDTKAVLRRHLRGEISVTANDLKCTDWEGKPPRLIVLHALECTGAEAYNKNIQPSLLRMRIPIIQDSTVLLC